LLILPRKVQPIMRSKATTTMKNLHHEDDWKDAGAAPTCH
jgi:hypothetical protein